MRPTRTSHAARLPLWIAAAVIVVACGAPAALGTPVVLVDYATIDFGDTGQRVEPGATGIFGSGSSAVGPVSVTADDGSMFDVSTSTVDWRDRGDVTNSTEPLALMGEDHIKVNSGSIDLTLSSLPAGTYEITSYHIDGGFILSNQIDIRLTDAINTNQLLPVSGNADAHGRPNNGSAITPAPTVTTAVMEASSATFTVLSDGINDIVLNFNGANGTSANSPQFPISGLQISQAVFVPEPSSALLLGLGFVALSRRRRRQAK